VATIWVHTIWPRINVSREYAASCLLVTGARMYTHVWRRNARTHRASRRFILQHTHHAVPRALRDLQTAAVRPSINLFNPIIRILCVRHRSPIGDGDRELQWWLSMMIDTANFEESTLWIPPGFTKPRSTLRSFTSKWTWQGRLYRNVHYSNGEKEKGLMNKWNQNDINLSFKR